MQASCTSRPGDPAAGAAPPIEVEGWELRQIVGDVVARELSTRANGSGEAASEMGGVPDAASPVVGLDAASAAPPASKRCRACRQEKPLPDFRPGRSICRACRNVQNRESAARRHGPKTAEDDDEVHPAPLRSFVGGDYGGLVSRSDREAAEQRRELLASLRGNGVEHELRDGRQYVVLRLPEGERTPAPGEGAGRPARPARAIPLARLFERLRGRGGPRPRAIEGGDE